MPCIIIKTNQVLSKEEKLKCCHTISAKIADMLGKPESYVMTLLDTSVSMTMSGTSEPTAYVELKSIGLPEDNTTDFSNKLCQELGSLLNIATLRIYIEFSNAQRHLWGWDGKTF